ncbi:hypothetical protein PLCT1_00800 [Planctomycetaceae bacterium]|nr:hypothetical protein PLCT1_00800 [Planctomycetaceae bacterium]
MKNKAANACEAALRADARPSTPGSGPIDLRPALRYRVPSRVSADDGRTSRSGVFR